MTISRLHKRKLSGESGILRNRMDGIELRSQTKWQLKSNQTVTLRSWDNEFVVYNSLSGDTHLVGPAAAEILAQLQRAPADVAALAGEMCRTWEVDATEEFALQLHEILADLRTLALIEEAA